MISFFHKFLQRRNVVNAEAAELLKLHGQDAWQHAFSRMRNLSLSVEERSKAAKLLREIERHHGIKRQTDTATRYLE
jgi:hypothetical protein